MVEEVIQTDRTQLSTATGSYILSPNAPTGGVDAINEFQQGLRGILQADNIDDSSWPTLHLIARDFLRMDISPPRARTAKKPASGGTIMELHQEKPVTSGTALLIFNTCFALGTRYRA
ncbi:hypothetical protein PCANC_07863 [Puccinia coronata f. sp. avenae]|uniref:Uncharacterized protein n=1 Tax=Puccinia coronata f. sp. avenae TaxID=200324 RepID=A0A2N5UN29_9BASI|nr:hypothetical protein PCASD_12867 [Puccinia coronata f. sp. avenae]PLW37805.1 hypothetical protein PCASD_11334 [Puccinia coronata f. sp. avenae]PLW39174.1 hypothetical protein PCASD_07616 [Puccinia coronata f. sp. avenae]PLW47846.1 hypothetical protein PCANC_07863 [Puccinia coronata f. sp. avenae]